MKKLYKYCFLIFLITSCDSEDSGDCFQKAGAIEQYEISVSTFSKILVNERVELIIKDGPIEKVILETGKNLFNDVSINVIDNKLIVSNNNKCNFIREYGITKIYVTSPNITEIRNSSELTVTSDGALSFPNLTLLTEDWKSDYLNIGDFNIEVNNTSTRIVSNGISNFFIEGNTTNLNIVFASGDSRFEGENLIASNITISSKSTNDILVNPQNKIEGNIYSLGDVISFNEPAIINVTEHYKGKLIFK